MKFSSSFVSVFLFGLLYLFPAMASASIYQDVQNFLNANPAPSGCINWVEEVTEICKK
ncbi:MAG TPA: hypothetical protein VJ202_00310 [Thermodesulfobacteriota bacterium]|nr:hypothetical protein [Thermodesulfobacteriota bacterium]